MDAGGGCLSASVGLMICCFKSCGTNRKLTRRIHLYGTATIRPKCIPYDVRASGFRKPRSERHPVSMRERAEPAMVSPVYGVSRIQVSAKKEARRKPFLLAIPSRDWNGRKTDWSGFASVESHSHPGMPERRVRLCSWKCESKAIAGCGSWCLRRLGRVERRFPARGHHGLAEVAASR